MIGLIMTRKKYYISTSSLFGNEPCGTVYILQDCDIEIEIQPRNYVHFLTNADGKGINPLFPWSGFNSISAILQGWF